MAFTDRLHNRGSISTGYDIDNSVKLEPDNTEYLSRTIGSTSNRKTFTVSCWFKRTELKAGAANANGHMLFMSGVDAAYMVSLQFHTWQDTYADTLEFRVDGANNNNTTRRFRDTSAWYHIVLAVDTTQATEANRWKLYVNGVQETSFSQTSYPSQNADTYNNVANSKLRIGSKWYAGTESGYFAGYIADYYHIDGQALAPTDFGEFDEDSGIWKPKAYTGSFGTNGWYLDFVDGANLGDDESGNGNDFTENNITAADQATDTPTNNFCTWNPLWTFPIGRTISEGGTNVDGASAWGGCKGTIGVTNGKWYWENKASGNDTIIGWQTDNYIPESNENSMHNIKDTIGFYQDGNNVWIRDETSGRTDATTTGTNASGQIIGMALDLDSSPQTATFYRNGSAISSAINIDGLTGKTIFPFMSQYNQNAESNFGGFCTYTISSAATDENGYGTFEYAPPSGYYALCGKNLAEYGGTA